MVRHRSRPSPHVSSSTSAKPHAPRERAPQPTPQTTANGEKNYSVGYGKPPKHTRFKPGQSGNPKGRQKGKRNFQTDLEEELFRRVQVTEGGQQKTVTLQQLMAKNLVRKAAKGEVRSEKLLIELIFRLGLHQISEGASEELTASDKAVLDRFLQDELKRLSDSRGKTNVK